MDEFLHLLSFVKKLTSATHTRFVLSWIVARTRSRGYLNSRFFSSFGSRGSNGQKTAKGIAVGVEVVGNSRDGVGDRVGVHKRVMANRVGKCRVSLRGGTAQPSGCQYQLKK